MLALYLHCNSGLMNQYTLEMQHACPGGSGADVAYPSFEASGASSARSPPLGKTQFEDEHAEASPLYAFSDPQLQAALNRSDWEDCSRLLGNRLQPDALTRYMQAIVSWQRGDIAGALWHAQAACDSRMQASNPCAAEQYLLGQLLVCRACAFTGQSDGHQQRNLLDALSCFEKAAQDAPDNTSVQSCMAFTCFHQGRDGHALRAAEHCLCLCSCQGIEMPPHVRWLRSVLQQPGLPQKLRSGMLPPADVQRQILKWTQHQINHAGSLIWQGSDVITALPLLTRRLDKANAVQLLSQYSITPVAQWILHPMVMEPCHIKYPRAQGKAGPRCRHAESGCSQKPNGCSSGSTIDGCSEDAQGRTLAISFRRPQLMAQLRGPLADFLCLLLGWQPSDGHITSMQCQRQLAAIIMEMIILQSDAAHHESKFQPSEGNNLQVAMLMLSRLTVRTITAARGWPRQLFFRGWDGSSISIMGPGIPSYQESFLALALRWEGERLKPQDHDASMLAIANARHLEAPTTRQISISTMLQWQPVPDKTLLHEEGRHYPSRSASQVPAAMHAHCRAGASERLTPRWLIALAGCAVGAAVTFLLCQLQKPMGARGVPSAAATTATSMDTSKMPSNWHAYGLGRRKLQSPMSPGPAARPDTWGPASQEKQSTALQAGVQGFDLPR